MQLYDLRREAKMREARSYFVLDFKPESAEDWIKVATAFGTKENTYFRQVFSYWSMAASLVLHGAVDKGLFNEWAAEMYFMWAKLQPHIGEIRTAMGIPEFLQNIEKFIEGDADGRKRRQAMQERQKRFAEMRAAGGRS
jgi:hypothetical protein